jgi:hypothetical protein
MLFDPEENSDYFKAVPPGCVDPNATNYNPDAAVDECGVCNGDGIADGTCDCDGNVEDCAGICGGSSTIDNCDVCGGDNADMDCVGVCGGSAVEDCAGECGGSAEVDECGVCGGDGSSCGSALQIISPNGGENWNKSGSYTIQWQSGSSDTHVHLEIWKGGSKYQDIYYYLDNSGSYSWYISPAYPSGNDYQVKVIGWQSGLSDLSNNNFTIY